MPTGHDLGQPLALAGAKHLTDPQLLVTALQSRTHPLMLDRLESMFQGSADLLLELSDKTRSNQDRRLYLDTIRTLRLVREQVQLLFMSEFGALFRLDPVRGPDAVDTTDTDPDELMLKPDELLEEMIIISNIASSVEGRCPALIWEVQRRLETARDMGVLLNVEGFTPASICQAFRKAASALDVPGEIKLVIYKVFEHFVAAELPLFYAALNQVFDEYGVVPAHLRKSRLLNPAAASTQDFDLQAALRQIAQFASPAPAGAMGGLSGNFAPLTNNQLAPSWPPSSGPAGDQQLVSRLQDALQRAAMGGVSGGSPWVTGVAHRMSLAGSYMDSIVSDTRLPVEARGALEQLRLSVLKVALADESFFSSPDHPLCKLVNELYAMSLAAPVVGGGSAVRQVGELIREVRHQLDLPADGVISGIESTRKVRDADVASFMHWQERATEHRRQAVVQRVKSVVSHEISTRLADTDIPESHAPVLMNGFSPVMCVLLARHGRESAEWAAAVRRLDQVVDSLRLFPKSPEQLPPREKLLRSIEKVLEQAGMTSTRLEQLMDSLRDAYSILDRRRTESDAEGERIAEEVRREVQASNHASEISPELRDGVEAILRDGVVPEVNLDDALEKVFQEPPANSEPEADHIGLLASLLTPEAWFRVYAPDEDATHWL
ncbi:MAG: DUF1631 family protein, partial [Stenotrophobium sp.]